MFFSFSIKTRLLISGALLALGIFIILQGLILQDQDAYPVRAATAQNIRGWGWSEGIGWVSMNCYNDYNSDGAFDNCCPGGNTSFCSSYGGLAGGNYGVHYNSANNKITGWAWSDRAGWICFGHTCNTICLDGTNNGNTCSVHADCPGGVCGGKPPHGRAKPWTCVGLPTWTCSGGANNGLSCIDNNGCPDGYCVFGCSGDAGESFVDTTNACTQTSSIMAHWKMNSIGSGGIVSDEAGNIGGTTDNAFLMPDYTGGNSPVQAKGEFSLALQFDGTDDYMQANDSADLSVSSNLAVEAWVKRGSAGTEQTVVGKWDELANDKSYRLWFGTDNKLNFTVSGATQATVAQDSRCIGGTYNTEVCATDADCGGVCILGTNNGTACTDNTACTGGGMCDRGVCKNPVITDTKKWHHVAGKYISGSNPFLRLFVDGELVGAGNSTTGTVPTSLTGGSQKLYIGAKKGSTVMNTYFNGAIDNVSVWSCPRTGNEIWDDAKIEISGWARAISAGGGGWLSLRGFTFGDKVWGSYLKDYLGFYTFGGFISERQNNETVDTTGLIAHWKMSEAAWAGTSGEVVDSSTSGTYAGTSQGGLTTTTMGIFGNAASFDGVDDYIYKSVADFRSTDSAGTISAWIKTSASAYQRIFTSSDEAADNHYIGIGVNSSGKFTIQTMELSNENLISGNTTVNDGNWHFVAVTSSGSEYKLYVDGALETLTITSGSNNGNWFEDVTLRDNVTLGIMKRYSGITNPFNGSIDNIALYSRAKAPSEISNDYARKNPYSMGWGDYDYDDPPEPVAFDTLSIDNSINCDLLSVQWEPSTWAEEYTYWRKQGASSSNCTACTSESTCSSNGYTEYNYLGSCSETECSLSDTGLSENTGYCYNIYAHNETGDTFITDNTPTYPAPQWKSTVLCEPEIGLSLDTSVCGQITAKWDGVTSADGYNIYRSLASAGCDDINDISGSCDAIGHLGEALDYDADDDGTNDLIAHWKLNESSGTEIGDSSGNSNTGTATDANLVNADTDTPPSIETSGNFSSARTFDGTDDYITVGDMQSHNNTAYTIEFWVNGSTQDDKRFYSESNTADANPFFGIGSGTGTGDTGKVRIYVVDDDSTVALDTESTSDVLDSTWHQAVWTDNNGTYKLYIDGEQNLSGSYTKVSKTFDDSNIGRHNVNSSPGSYYAGTIDNIAIYDVIKSPEQVRIDYEAGALSTVCHEQGVDDSKCDKEQADASACCYTDERIVPFTNYYYVMTASSEAGESPASSALTGQTICYPPAPETEEE